MADNLGLFDTPMLRYLSMKRIFLEKFLDPKFWRGEFGSKEQIIVLDGVLTYFQKTRNLAEEFPQLMNDVVTENKNLIMQRILPMPLKLYEQLLLELIEDGEGDHSRHQQQTSSETLGRIITFVEKRKISSLALYQHKVWQDVNCFEKYSFEQICDGHPANDE